MRLCCSRESIRAVFAGVIAISCIGPAIIADAFADEPVAKAGGRQDLLAVAAVRPAPAAAQATTRTRFVVGLDRKVEFQVFSLANPNRVVVELPDVKLHLPDHSGDAAVGLVKSFRGGLAAS
ncbi:MAG TPA: AMIN domain-containing protein, partial [Hyphomicrobium sp.]|nr:AMIN domain-containing protein [Hyphomicrobium sp.]